MKINIKTIYKNNIFQKYDFTNRDDFEKDFTPKEQSMWFFTLYLLKQNNEKTIYDNEIDQDSLVNYLSAYLVWMDKEIFTIEEWFDYLKDK